MPLSQANDNASTLTFDNNGNRNGGSYSTQYNQMTADADWNYYYDHSGRLTKKIEVGTGIAWKYFWNAASELTLWTFPPALPN